MANELDDWIRDQIAPTLRERGFRGGPRRFRRRSQGFVAGIQFQGSSGNVLGLMHFRINFGVRHEDLASMTGSESLDDWQVARAVSGKRGEDVWWDVGVGSERSSVAGRVLDALSRDVLPFLEAASTPEGFRATLAAYPKPWGDDLLRQLDSVEAYDAAGDRRTPAQRRRDAIMDQPVAGEWIEEHPEIADLVDMAGDGPSAVKAWLAAHPDTAAALAKAPRRPSS